jgi:hypothetical protein
MMSIPEVITASDSQFVELDRVEWVVFLKGINDPENDPEKTMVNELRCGANASPTPTVIVYRWQAKVAASFAERTAP